MTVIDRNATSKKLTNEELKRSKKTWITKGILTSVKKKNILLKNIIKSSDQVTFLRYNTYRDKIHHLIRKSKKNTIIISSKKQHRILKKTWKQVNSIIHKGKIKDAITFIKTAKGFESDTIV